MGDVALMKSDLRSKGFGSLSAGAGQALTQHALTEIGGDQGIDRA